MHADYMELGKLSSVDGHRVGRSLTIPAVMAHRGIKDSVRATHG
jgi:hypothetical protein